MMARHLPVPNNEGKGPPPDGAKDEARQFLWTTARAVAAKKVERFRQRLDAKRPLVLECEDISVLGLRHDGGNG
jgi:hypothetical protein